jgi:hypothetical protein
MKKMIANLFSLSFKGNQRHEISIESDMPLTVKGVPYDDVLKMKRYLENLRVGQSFPIPPRLEYTIRKIAHQHFQDYKISIRNTGEFRRVYRLA